MDRAVTALLGFAVTNDNAGAIAQVCHRLDGIPLAIELAAARIRLLRVEQIAERLADRFQLLTGGERTALPRHQTLAALIDWSHDLLTEPERLLLRRLSVFAGGWMLDAAEAVCVGDVIEQSHVLDLLTQLVNKSLVIAERVQGKEARYRMLETIRQYARVKLSQAGEGELLSKRHLAYFVDLAERGETNLRAFYIVGCGWIGSKPNMTISVRHWNGRRKAMLKRTYDWRAHCYGSGKFAVIEMKPLAGWRMCSPTRMWSRWTIPSYEPGYCRAGIY